MREACARRRRGPGLRRARHRRPGQPHRPGRFRGHREAWGPRGLRQRIEHVQVLHPDDLPRFAALGVLASVQPIHATQDMDLVDRLWGARGRYAYAFAACSTTGRAWPSARRPGGDAGPGGALRGRRPAPGGRRSGLVPRGRISLEEALRAYTDAAYARRTGRDGGHPGAGEVGGRDLSLARDVLREPAGAPGDDGDPHGSRGQVVYSAT